MLDIANEGATASIFSTVIAAGNTDSGYQVGYFKIGKNDALIVTMKLQAGKIITITGSAIPSNTAKNSSFKITQGTGTTGAVDSYGNQLSVSGTTATAINYTITVTTEGVIVLNIARGTVADTGCNLTALTVKISSPEPVNVESVELDKTTSALKVGETETLTATVTPANADNTNVIWSSSDETIASVVNGVVTAKKAGTVTITVTAVSDTTKSATCTYTITNVAPTSIELNRTEATIAVGETVNLSATVKPDNATVKTVTWSSSDSAIATVDANGVVTAVAAGNVTITATSTDDASVKATCSIEVKTTIVYATNITLNYSNEDLKVDETLQLEATILPAETDDKTVTWTTSNSAVATVSASGLVTIVGEGTVKITATSNSNSALTAECNITATYQTYTVTFMNGSTNEDEKVVRKGQTTTALSLTKQGYYLEGWYESSTFSGTAFDFSTPITADITLYAKWEEAAFEITYSQGNLESAALEWEEMNASAATVSYKLASADDSAYVAVDSELIRQVDSDTARVDVVGLKGGVDYTFKIKASSQGEAVKTLSVKKYDRSGYAHFNYTSGVGAYKDDGTLKDNAIVLYVTDDNKNTVTLSYGGVTVTGIGNILNSVGQDTGSGTAENGGTANSNQGILKLLGQNNIPLVVRFIGCVSDTGLYEAAVYDPSSVSLINGLTVYNSTGCGGTAGDNGHMARMKSAKDVTLEGIGEDAVIDGWGFHFMCESSSPNLGKSFEVRNLTFINTPEDAVGMEGQQESGTITAGVERCWIHNNEFYGPNMSVAAESDKKEGDGSCDFKRGQYFTCSYNYFEGCHKTNLVGASDSNLQFNLTYHHNYWRLCKARGPLARQANIHMYNNVFEEQTDYCMNPRASSYIFSEYNLFYMCKNPQDVAGGALKSYNDSFSSCIGSMAGTVVTSKTQTVSNSCKYGSIDYSKFDTTASQSYIPDGNYELQESVTEARKVIAAYGGVTKRNVKAVEEIDLSELALACSSVTPVKASVPSKLTPGKIEKTAYAFTINSAATVTISYSSDTYSDTGVLLNQAGECLLTASGSVVLEPGTYIVQPTNFQPGDSKALTHGVFKSVTINSIEFVEYNSAELDAKLIADYNTKAALIDVDAIAYDTASYQLIANAQNAYARLSDELKTEVTVDYDVVTAAYTKYVDLGEAYVEGLISAIGTVDENSGSAISKARSAYSQLISVAPEATVSNYSTLTVAEAAYESFKVQGLINQITALADPATATTEEAITSLLEEYQSVQNAYDALDESQKTQVTNYSKVTDGITALNAKLAEIALAEEQEQAYTDITAKLEAVTSVESLSNAECADIVALYDKLSAEKQTEIAANATYIAVKAKYDEYASQAKVAIFGKPADNTIDPTMTPEAAGFTITGTIGYKSTSETFTYNGVTYYSPMKYQSGNAISFSTTAKMKVTIMLHSGKAQTLSIDDSGTLTATNGIIEYTVEAGNHSIGRVGEAWICYIVLSPVA
ncbi:MAG: Ig-like domain-containing protein [Candidatus Coproplasma sp.]